MGAFLRRNLFIVLGVSLPLALIALVLIVQAVHRWGAVPPATPVLYVHSADWVVREHLQAEVVDGRLRLELRVPERATYIDQFRNATLELAVHDPRAGTTRVHPIDVAIPDGASAPVRLAVPAELFELELDPSPVSPDGARLIVDRRSGGGLFGELFRFGGRAAEYRLVVDGVGFDVPGQPLPYGRWPGFIAWVVGP